MNNTNDDQESSAGLLAVLIILIAIVIIGAIYLLQNSNGDNTDVDITVPESTPTTPAT